MQTDKEIVDGVRKNERKAVEFLYKLNRESFFNYVRMNSGSDDEAKDILQDAVIILYEKIIEDKLALTSSLKTYLTAICQNLWLKKLKGMEKTVSLPIILEHTLESIDIENEQLTESTSILMYHFDKLGDKCKDLLIQRFWKNMKMNERQKPYLF